MTTTAARLDRIAKAYGLSKPSELAKLIGVRPSTIWRWVSGESAPGKLADLRLQHLEASAPANGMAAVSTRRGGDGESALPRSSTSAPARVNVRRGGPRGSSTSPSPATSTEDK